VVGCNWCLAVLRALVSIFRYSNMFAVTKYVHSCIQSVISSHSVLLFGVTICLFLGRRPVWQVSVRIEISTLSLGFYGVSSCVVSLYHCIHRAVYDVGYHDVLTRAKIYRYSHSFFHFYSIGTHFVYLTAFKGVEMEVFIGNSSKHFVCHICMRSCV